MTVIIDLCAPRKLRPSLPGPKDRTSLLLLPGTFFLQQTLALDARDAFLDIAAFSEDGPVVISGGQVLQPAWSSEGPVRTATFPGTCAEVILVTLPMYLNLGQGILDMHY